MADEIVFNLTAFAERLTMEGRKKDIVLKIRSAVDARSIEVDLMLALDACAALAFSFDNHMQQPANFREASEAALLSNIVLLYARATKTKSGARKEYDPRPKFNDAEKKVHTELCDLRDKAVAHYGKGGSYTGNWTIELAVLDVGDTGAWPAILTRRLVVDRALLARAHAQIQRALEVIGPVVKKRMDAFTDAINAECAVDPGFYKEVQQHPLNVAIFLGGERQAAQMAAGRSTGRARGAFGHS